MGILINNSSVSEIFVGGAPVKEVWVGSQLTWQRSGTPRVIFDNADVTWAKNLIPSPTSDYNKYAAAGFITYSGERVIRIGCVSPNASAGLGYVNFTTQQFITIPVSAKTLHIRVNHYKRYEVGSQYGKVQFGLIPPDAPNSLSVEAGGQVSDVYHRTTSGWFEMSMALANVVKGATGIYKLALTWSGPCSGQNYVYINKIWFE